MPPSAAPPKISDLVEGMPVGIGVTKGAPVTGVLGLVMIISGSRGMTGIPSGNAVGEKSDKSITPDESYNLLPGISSETGANFFTFGSGTRESGNMVGVLKGIALST